MDVLLVVVPAFKTDFLRIIYSYTTHKNIIKRKRSVKKSTDYKMENRKIMLEKRSYSVTVFCSSLFIAQSKTNHINKYTITKIRKGKKIITRDSTL